MAHVKCSRMCYRKLGPRATRTANAKVRSSDRNERASRRCTQYASVSSVYRFAHKRASCWAPNISYSVACIVVTERSRRLLGRVGEAWSKFAVSWVYFARWQYSSIIVGSDKESWAAFNLRQVKLRWRIMSIFAGHLGLCILDPFA